ncbi:MAG: prepilin-type N-terminal cleavage/methylation domain-containing protein [Candidatus Omnitrophica bacterium]|nr:prepilin-type N-terminal cleavage/methylation domain-containing protein [Candidatus Omnitrophota bacterium]
MIIIKRNSFTLIELILVVGIIAILAGAVIPIIQQARLKAWAAKIVQLIATLRNACVMFHSDTGLYAMETQNGTDLNFLSANPTAIANWDGPYIDRPLYPYDFYKDNLTIIAIVHPQMVTTFDLDGDGTFDKLVTSVGNSLVVALIPENLAREIDRSIDINTPGDWRINGRVGFTPSAPFSGRGALFVYLIGGSS